MFDRLIESSSGPKRPRSRSVLFSLLAHVLVLGMILVIPLVYYQGLPKYELLTALAAPPQPLPPPPPPGPPAPPPPPGKKGGDVQVVRPDPGDFLTPTTVPDEIPAPDETIPFLSELGAASSQGVPGGSPDGIPWGVPGNTAGSLLGFAQGSAVPPPPPPPEQREPRRVSSGAQVARLIHKVDPVYPELARRARVAGVVLLQVTVDETGLVESVRLIRGHPLLNQAALDAVRQWRYSPTLLNGEPVPVIATVTVNFVLN